MNKSSKKPKSHARKEQGGSYTVLARRYRSRHFDELVGQEPIARTLQNAIKSGRTAHAYLFCGTRGVGKTSMARIFAAALNTDDSLAERDEIAEAIFRGDDLDVIEIDGASNRGIADAKDLIAGAGLSPARCRYKIYIIDEVHALTKDAFNALLKTMEEPPSHVKFILCTTEAHKVPATIQSRCQRFDFRPLSATKIADQLHNILDKEGISADDDVILRVAQLGNGSMRDALSLMDRLLAAGDGHLTADLLEQMVGLPDHALVENLMAAINAGDPAEAIRRADALLRQGPTVEQALELLLNHLRNLMLITACGEDSELVELSADARNTAIEQASHFDTAGLVHLIALCDAVERNARNSATGRALFDAVIVRMSMSEHFASISEVLRDNRVPAPTSNAAAGKKKVLPARERVSTSASPAPAVAVPAVTEVKPTREAGKPLTGQAIWDRVVEHVADSPSAQAKIAGLTYESFDGTTLHLSINDQGAAVARWLRTHVDALTELVHKATGQRVQVNLDGGEDRAPAAPAADTNAVREAEKLPAVRQAMDIFNARVIDVSDA